MHTTITIVLFISVIICMAAFVAILLPSNPYEGMAFGDWVLIFCIGLVGVVACSILFHMMDTETETETNDYEMVLIDEDISNKYFMRLNDVVLLDDTPTKSYRFAIINDDGKKEVMTITTNHIEVFETTKDKPFIRVSGVNKTHTLFGSTEYVESSNLKTFHKSEIYLPKTEME